MKHLLNTDVYSIHSMSEEDIRRVEKLEQFSFDGPQLEIETTHTLHGGLYARTVFLPKCTLITGALIKIETALILAGYLCFYKSDTPSYYRGYHVLPAGKNRKSAVIALEDSHMTMLFPTSASSVTEAEQEFTDEHEALMTNRHPETHKTGDTPCLD